MALFQLGEIIRIYDVSTSKNSPSCIADSYGTPFGLHRIEKIIGEGEPSGMVFCGRVPTGHLYYDNKYKNPSSNLITSRILRLKGLEQGVNSGLGCDSYDRYIYVHGTNHEDRIGKPFSKGCIEMRNLNIIELATKVKWNDLILVLV
jgi:hypothetical protein